MSNFLRFLCAVEADRSLLPGCLQWVRKGLQGVCFLPDEACSPAYWSMFICQSQWWNSAVCLNISSTDCYPAAYESGATQSSGMTLHSHHQRSYQGCIQLTFCCSSEPQRHFFWTSSAVCPTTLMTNFDFSHWSQLWQDLTHACGPCVSWSINQFTFLVFTTHQGS